MKIYRYLTGKDDANFCARVTQALNDGYELYGAPTMTFNGTDVIVGQAIIQEFEHESDIPDTVKKSLKLVP
jgi:hypothetical protein